LGSHFTIQQRLNIATSDSGAAGVCHSPSLNSAQKKCGFSPRLGELPNTLGFPFNIYATAEADNFKLGLSARFAKAHHKITAEKWA